MNEKEIRNNPGSYHPQGPSFSGNHEAELSWEQYQRLFDIAPIGYVMLDRDAKILDATTRAAQLLGRARQELLGLSFSDFIDPDSSDVMEFCHSAMLQSEDWQECEAELQPANGSPLVVTLQGRQVTPGKLAVFMTDITNRKAAEIALKDSETRYRDVADRLAEGIFEADPHGNVLYANHKALASLGLTSEDLKKGLNIFNHIAPEDHTLATERMGRILKREDVGAGEYKLLKKDGTPFTALVHSLAILRDGKVIGVRGLMVDFTERKQTETALHESERKYRELAELLGSGVFEADLSGTLTYANRKGLELFNLTEADINRGVTVFEFLEEGDLARARENLTRILNGEDLGSVEYTMKRTDGTYFPGLTYTSAAMRENVVVGIRGVVVDISDLKEAERALRDSERKYRDLTDLLDEGIFETDTVGKITYANRRGMAYVGITEEDLGRGLTIFDIIRTEDLALAQEKLAAAAGGADTGATEFEIVRKDGTAFPALAHGSAIIRDGTVVGVRGVVFDISELKQVERALKQSEERFRILIKSLHEGIWVLDKDDITTYVNPRMAEMLGYNEEDFIGKPVWAFNPPEWKQFVIDSLERRQQGVSEQLEGEYLHKNGSRVYVLLEASPILDDDGNYVGSIAGVQDITGRRLGEERLRQAIAELDRSNKELEQFAYVTSHDLREPLRMMTSFSQSLEKRYKDKLDATAGEYIGFIVDGAARMQKLIDDILLYSRVSTRGQPFEKVSMETVLETALVNLTAAIEEAKAVINHGPLPEVTADGSQMAQVFQNLIGNAIKFHRDDAAPVIEVSAAREKDEWVFTVRDNGIGMDPELFGKLFNLFQRLHPPDKYPGTGVGLAITKKIVQRHKGRIWVESEPDKGSTFYFTLPVTQ